MRAGRGHCRGTNQGRRRRAGVILVIVLVVVAALSLAAYAFSELMITHYEAVQLSGRRVQAQSLVDSGVSAVRMYLLADEQGRMDLGGHFNNPAYFQAVSVVGTVDREDRANFSVLAANLDPQGNLAGVRYGLEDESTRLNLNTLLLADQVQQGGARTLLMGLPNMTEDVADAILDWMDEDDEPREYGAEVDYYSMLRPAYGPRNGPLQTVEELLLIRGVTPRLLFGTDTNRNGMLDPGELNQMGMSAAGGAMLPTLSSSSGDSGLSSGSMDRGWAGYLTLYSRERNVDALGQPRIDLNMEDLELLHDTLVEQFDESWARFIVAYRQSGPYTGDDEGTLEAEGELDLAQPGQNQIGQVLDLIGAKVRVRFSGSEEPTVLRSPFSDELLEMAEYLPILMDAVTANAAPVIPGRININQAPRAILLGIPGMSEATVEEILGQRNIEPEGESIRTHETWLLAEGLVTLDQMKTLMPFVTAGGDVYRAQVVGYYEAGGAAARAEVVVDATEAVPRVVFWRDISHLGRGYPLDVLGIQMRDQ